MAPTRPLPRSKHPPGNLYPLTEACPRCMEAILVQFRSGLSGEEGARVKKKREAAFREIPGLLQVFFLEPRAENDLAAFFVFDSDQSLEAFLETDVVQRTPEEMKVKGELDRTRFEVTSTLYELD